MSNSRSVMASNSGFSTVCPKAGRRKVLHILNSCSLATTPSRWTHCPALLRQCHACAIYCLFNQLYSTRIQEITYRLHARITRNAQSMLLALSDCAYPTTLALRLCKELSADVGDQVGNGRWAS
jgi:hypothetical protein